MTFCEPSSNTFVALGHGIIDIDTSDLINIAKGDLVTTDIVSIEKGKKGLPGEIKGTIDNATKIGEIYKNTNFGVYGKAVNLSTDKSKAIDVALRSEIKFGKAYIMCELENGKIDRYEIEIEKIYSANNNDNKSMIIKVTDKKLIEKTGGIIQGMSGAPIVQNGKFIGAVTHVFVNEPTVGYAVFADMLIKQMSSVQ